MEKQKDSFSWQDLLRQLIEDIHERQRLAGAARVKPITLQRWASGASKPRYENMRTLLRNLPADSYPAFVRLISADFPGLLQEDPTLEQIHQDLPSEFYTRVLYALALTPQSICRQTVQDLILQQTLKHPVPDCQGMSICLTSA